MKKIIYFNTINFGYRVFYNSVSEDHSDLDYIFSSFHPQRDWVVFDKDGDDFLIWCEFLEEEFDSIEDVPKLRVSVKNYRAIQKQWNDNIDNGLEPYLVLWQDEETGWISLDAKQELSLEDLQHVAEEKKKERARLHEHCQRSE